MFREATELRYSLGWGVLCYQGNNDSERLESVFFEGCQCVQQVNFICLSCRHKLRTESSASSDGIVLLEFVRMSYKMKWTTWQERARPFCGVQLICGVFCLNRPHGTYCSRSSPKERKNVKHFADSSHTKIPRRRGYEYGTRTLG